MTNVEGAPMSVADDLQRAILDEHRKYRATISDLDQETLETEPALCL